MDRNLVCRKSKSTVSRCNLSHALGRVVVMGTVHTFRFVTSDESDVQNPRTQNHNQKFLQRAVL